LCEENAEVGELVDRARSAGVVRITTVGIDVESSNRSAQIARNHDLLFTAGVHPNSAGEWSDVAAEAVSVLLSDRRSVAVGETGLDYFRDECPKPQQKVAFRDHIELARVHSRALVIHTRESVTDALNELDRAGPPDRLVFHCWSGTAEELQRAVEMGSFVSFAGNISFKNADRLRSVAPLVPHDRLLVETDSPFLSPVPNRGRPNEPAFVADVGTALAQTTGMSTEELALITTRNAHALFAR
jgi:TatD DNase family protein